MRADDFGDRGGEGDDVVADLGFDLVDAVEVEVGALADGVGGVFGNQAGFGEGFGGGDFDGEPGAEAVFVAPDAGHLGAGIAGNHVRSPRPAGTEDSKWTGGIRLVLRVQRSPKNMHHGGTRGTEEYWRKTPSLMTTGQERWGTAISPIRDRGVLGVFPYFISVHDIMERD